MYPAKFLRVLVFLCGLVTAAGVRADLVIEITEGVRGALPIAIVPFANLTGQALSVDIAQVISDDLQRSGDFDPMPRTNMLSLPSKEEDVYFRDWSIVGQRYLLVGNITYDPQTQQNKTQYELLDVQSEQALVGRVISGGPALLRDMAHAIADTVYEALTGKPGVFSTKLAYVTLDERQGKPVYSLEVSDADGQRSKMVFRSNWPIISPAWSPDGKMLAYVSFESGRPAIFLQNIETEVRSLVANYKGLNSAPAWSPDGTRLAMTLSKDGNAEIYIQDLRNGQLRRLTNHWAIDTEPSWSPDGKSIVFTSDRGGGPQVYMVDVAGGRPQRLTFEGNYNARPRFSLDGNTIYYVHQRSGFNVAALDMASGQNKILTETDMDESPSVAPNGSMIIYATQRQGKGVLAVVGVNSGSKYTLPAQFGDVREPAWSPYLKR